MRLLGFKYIKGQRILILALILALASALFSVTAFSLLGFYRGFTAYLGEDGSIVAIYDRKSRTPFTGLVPAYLAERIGVLNGVLAISPEVMAPCIVKGEAIFLRGIVPENFTKLNPLTIIEGGMLELGDLSSIIVGRRAAEKLGVKPNEKLLVLGVLTSRCIELNVKGIYESHSFPSMDDEVLAPLYVGQWLRGTDYGHVTLIRFWIDRSVLSPALIFEEVAKEASEPSPSQGEAHKPPEESIVPRIMARFGIEDLGVAEAQGFMRSFLERYGVTREALLILSVTVFFFSAASVAIASKTIIIEHKGEINVLRSIGASKKLLKMDILIKLLPWSLIASSIGIAIATAFLNVIQGCGYLQVFSHAMPLQLDLLTTALNFFIVSMLVSISIWGSGLE